MSTLVLDIGNTNITVGLYDSDLLSYQWRLATHRGRTADEYGLTLVQLLRRAGLQPRSVTGAALASVVPPVTPAIVTACAQYLGVLPLEVHGKLTRLLPAILYEDLGVLGADRLANAVGAWRVYGGGAGYRRPVAAIDFGTATKIEVVQADGTYLGGMIAPGVGTSMQALTAAAARLSRVAFDRPAQVLGRNNQAAVQSGVLYGFVGLVNGLIGRIALELGERPFTVATGGLAPLVAGEAAGIGVVDPRLTLAGIRQIWQWN